MSIYRDAYEQDWRDHDEGLYDPDVIVEREREDRLADIREMTVPSISVERIKPALPQPEYEPRRTVRAHEVSLGSKASLTDWIFFFGGVGIIAGWVLLLLALLLAWLAT